MRRQRWCLTQCVVGLTLVVAGGAAFGQGPGPGQGQGPGFGDPAAMQRMMQGMQGPGMGDPGAMQMMMMHNMQMQGMGGGPQACMTATADYVYVLRGPVLYQFSAKTLEATKKVPLGPEMPQMRMGVPPGMEGGGPQGLPGQPGQPPRPAPPVGRNQPGAQDPQFPGGPGQGGPGQFGGPMPGQNPFGQGNPGFPGMRGFPGQMMGIPSAIAASGDNLFVLRGNTLYKYSARTLEIVKKVMLEPEMPMMMPGMGRPDGRGGQPGGPGGFPGGPGGGGGFPVPPSW